MKNGSCVRKEILFANNSGFQSCTFSLLKHILPSYDRKNHDKSCMSVVFPAPFFPTTPYIFHFSRVNDTFRKTTGIFLSRSLLMLFTISSKASSIHFDPVFHHFMKFSTISMYCFSYDFRLGYEKERLSSFIVRISF